MPKGTWLNATNCWYEVLLVKEGFASNSFRYLHYVFMFNFLYNVSFFITVTFTVHFNISKTELCSVGSDFFS